MKTYINKLASYEDAPIQRKVNLDGLDEYIEKNIKYITRKHKKLQKVYDIQKGDIVTLDLESDNPKFNRSMLKLAVGTNMFDKELETALIDSLVGEENEYDIHGHKVNVLIKESIRNKYPTINDQLIEEYTLTQEGLEEIKTVQEYKDYLAEEYKNDIYLKTIGKNINIILDYVLSHTDFEFDESEIQCLYDMYMEGAKEGLKKEGKTLEDMSNEELEFIYGVHSLKEFNEYVYNTSKYAVASTVYLTVLDGKDPKDYAYEDAYGFGWDILENYVKQQMENIF